MGCKLPAYCPAVGFCAMRRWVLLEFAAEMDDFARCILDNKPSKASGEEGLRDVKIAMAIYESIREGGRPIKLA
jgi:predicted dehydrogenase